MLVTCLLVVQTLPRGLCPADCGFLGGADPASQGNCSALDGNGPVGLWEPLRV